MIGSYIFCGLNIDGILDALILLSADALKPFFFLVRFVDGESYFNAVADALENATEEIFIAGWW